MVGLFVHLGDCERDTLLTIPECLFEYPACLIFLLPTTSHAFFSKRIHFTHCHTASLTPTVTVTSGHAVDVPDKWSQDYGYLPNVGKFILFGIILRLSHSFWSAQPENNKYVNSLIEIQYFFPYHNSKSNSMISI